jgi:tetratricopeptide (TPR) repeat protein
MTDYEQIENYLQGKLQGDELQQFEQRLQNDPSFAETVKLYSNINNEIWGDEDEYALRQQLLQLNQQHFKLTDKAQVVPIKRAKHISYWAAASAAVVAGIIVTILLNNQQATPDRLFAELTTKDSLHATVRGSGDSLKLAIAQAYNTRQYNKALRLLEQYTKDDPPDAAYNFAKVVCYVETGKSTAAIPALDSLISGSSVYKYKAVAMKALIFFDEGKKDEAAGLLKTIPEGTPEYEKAQQLAKKLQ